MAAESVIVPIDKQEVTAVVLQGWLRRARRKFISGVLVLKVTSQGKLVRRTVFLGAKPEYFEITSAKLFDLGYHMSDIDEVQNGCTSPDFSVFQKQNPDRVTDADRRDFVFLMRVEIRGLQSKYSKTG